MSFDFKKYVDWNVYSVSTIDKKYGFRVRLIFSDGTEVIQQKSGYTTKKAAVNERDQTVADLHSGTYIAYGKIKTKDFMLYWLDEVMKKRITASSYASYRNAVKNYVIPAIGARYMETLNRAHIQNLYNSAAQRSIHVAPLVKTVMVTSLAYAKSKNMIKRSPADGVRLPKQVKKKEYRIRKIDVTKTLTQEQVEHLIAASKGTPIYMQILFASLMGLRKSEINGLKFGDVDYIHRTLKVERQLGRKPNAQKEDFEKKTFTKQEIGLKTSSSYRELVIPDLVFEAILEQRRIYEKNRRRRKQEFQDLDYICCSSYGNPRSMTFHYTYYKKLLQEQGLPNIRFHDLRSTYATILMKNNFNLKGISKMLGHSKEIISADVYGDTKEIIADCLDVLEPYMESVLPLKRDTKFHDFSQSIILDTVVEVYIL